MARRTVGPRRSDSRSEVVGFYFTNTANTRVFNVMLPGARMKLVGADSGHYEHEDVVEQVLLAPSERVVVDALFNEKGEVALEHRTPEKAYRLATIEVIDGTAEPDRIPTPLLPSRDGGSATMSDRSGRSSRSIRPAADLEPRGYQSKRGLAST